MDLQQLQEMGAFVAPTPILKEVSWTRTPDGATEERTDTFNIHVKKLSFGAIEQLLSPDNKQSERARMSSFIAATVMDDHAKPLFPFTKAFQLDPSLAGVLMTAINEVNGTRTQQPKGNGADTPTVDTIDDTAKN